MNDEEYAALTAYCEKHEKSEGAVVREAVLPFVGFKPRKS